MNATYCRVRALRHERAQHTQELLKIQSLEQKLAALARDQKEIRKLTIVGFVAIALIIWLGR